MRENLKNARKAAGMTQQQMADKLNIGLRHYQKGEPPKQYEFLDELAELEEKEE